MEKHTPGTVIHRIGQGSLHIGHRVIGTVKKIQYVLRQQFFILPFSVHLAVKTDIACKNNGCTLSAHNPMSFPVLQCLKISIAYPPEHGNRLTPDPVSFRLRYSQIIETRPKHLCSIFPLFPPLDIHTVFDFGQTSVTERNRCSPAGKYLPFRQMTKGENTK